MSGAGACDSDVVGVLPVPRDAEDEGSLCGVNIEGDRSSADEFIANGSLDGQGVIDDEIAVKNELNTDRGYFSGSQWEGGPGWECSWGLGEGARARK